MVTVDVRAVDEQAIPRSTILCECKHWGSRIPQTVVHAFRTVVHDAGATSGLLIATSGFQKGAYGAAAKSNLHVLTWPEFQELFASRWYSAFGARVLADGLDPLIDYVGPISNRISRRADALPLERREEFKKLRNKHGPFALALLPLLLTEVGQKAPPQPSLPFRRTMPPGSLFPGSLPEPVVQATSLRGFLSAVLTTASDATAEFDEVFGGRL